MSQRSEKYARNMDRRLGRLEERVDKINMSVTAHGVRVSTAEELIEAMGIPPHLNAATYSVQIAQDKPRKDARQAARRKRMARRRRLLLAAAMALVALVILVAVAARGAETGGAERTAAPVATIQGNATPIVDLLEPVDHPPTPEEIEEALLAQGYFSLAVPLPYDLQDAMRKACAEYGCPYPLALAVAEIESRFDPEAVGPIGETGIMQLNPGPGGSYHAELEAATGQDPNDPAGNIFCGVYLLGKYMDKYDDPAKAAMAYNMGESGARKAWANGVTSTKYTVAILEAVENWEYTVNAWNGV